MKCPNCGKALPGMAVLPLSFGTRSFICRSCGVLCRMKPRAYILWSIIPLVVMLVAALTVFVLGLWFLVLIIVLRAVWVLVAPRVVPLEFARPKN